MSQTGTSTSRRAQHLLAGFHEAMAMKLAVVHGGEIEGEKALQLGRSHRLPRVTAAGAGAVGVRG